jgi:hypothetical protein
MTTQDEHKEERLKSLYASDWGAIDRPMTSDQAVSIWREIAIGMSIAAQLVFDGLHYYVIVPYQDWSLTYDRVSATEHGFTNKQMDDLVALARRFNQPYWNHNEAESFQIGAARETA